MSEKISEFVRILSVDPSGLLTVVQNGQNFSISQEDYLQQFGVTGSLEQAGSVTATPVLDTQGTVNNIRNLGNGPGVKASVDPENGITLEHNIRAGNSGGAAIFGEIAMLSPIIRSIRANTPITAGVVDDSVVLGFTSIPTSGQTIPVNSLSDLPTPVLGVITLEDSTIYLFGSTVDISPNRLVLGDNTCLCGTSISISCVSSSTTGDFITYLGDEGFTINEICLDAPNATGFNASSVTPVSGFVSISRVNILAFASFGAFNSFNFLLFQSLLITVTGQGVVLTGAFNILNVSNVFVGAWTGTAINLGTATFNIISIDTQAFASTNPSNKIVEGAIDSGNINVGGNGTVRANSVLGVFTLSTTILPSDIRWNFSANFQLPDSVNSAHLAMPVNALQTAIAVINTPVIVNGVWTDSDSSRFTNDSTGRATYIGITPRIFNVFATFTMAKLGGGTDQYTFYIAKNGVVVADAVASSSTDSTRDVSMAIATTIDLITDDYIELWAENNTNTNNCVVYAANLVVSG